MRVYKKLIVLCCVLCVACQTVLVQEVAENQEKLTKKPQESYPLQLYLIRDSELVSTDTYIREQISSISVYLQEETPFYFTSKQIQTLPLARHASFAIQWERWQQHVGLTRTSANTVVLFIVPESALKGVKGAEHFVGYAETRGAMFQQGPAAAMVVFTMESEEFQYRILHELGHLFGATHTNKGSMATHEPGQTFSMTSLEEMQEHRAQMLKSTQSFRSQDLSERE